MAKGDDVIIDLDATLEDLYMGGSLKVGKHVVMFFFFCIFVKWFLKKILFAMFV